MAHDFDAQLAYTPAMAAVYGEVTRWVYDAADGLVPPADVEMEAERLGFAAVAATQSQLQIYDATVLAED